MPLDPATIRSLPFEDGQRDFPDRDGMFLRVGKRTKTFMVLTRSPRRKLVSLGHLRAQRQGDGEAQRHAAALQSD